jgi:hypothetical protein
MKQIILIFIASILVIDTLRRESVQLLDLISSCVVAEEHSLVAISLRGNVSHPESGNQNNDNHVQLQKNDQIGKSSSLENTLLTLWNHIPEPTEEIPAQQLELTNFIPSKQRYPQDDVVMITHTSTNKYTNLLIQIQWWGGPTDVAIYINKEEDIQALAAFLESSRADLVSTTFHIVMEKTAFGYPHNILRNLVLEHLKSDYFVAMDADFVTSPNAHGNLHKLIKANRDGIRDQLQQKSIFVLPAFELLAPPGADSPTEDMIPRNRNHVLEQLNQKSLLPFHAKWHGHTPTNYDQWVNMSSTSTQTSFPIKYEVFFEPYVLGYKHGMPRYWKNFRGFGYNKWSWFLEISKAGYEFFVLRDFWVAHLNHPISKESNTEARLANQPSYRKFEKYLNKFYRK